MTHISGGEVVEPEDECERCKKWMATYGVAVFFCRADEDRTVAQIKECFDKAEAARERVNDIPFTEEDFSDG
jgi:hypothetical protein